MNRYELSPQLHITEPYVAVPRRIPMSRAHARVRCVPGGMCVGVGDRGEGCRVIEFAVWHMGHRDFGSIGIWVIGTRGQQAYVTWQARGVTVKWRQGQMVSQ